MKKIGIILLVAALLPLSLSAQRQGQGRRFDEMLEKYQSERVAYLTEELSLSVSDAEKFWPLYNEYQEKRERMMRASHPGLGRPDADSLTVEQMKELMDTKIQNDLNMALLAQDYHDKFTDLLGVKKVFLLYRAEQEFMGYMLRRMRNHDGNPGSGQRGQGRRFTPTDR